jgi:hypothetical protein
MSKFKVGLAFLYFHVIRSLYFVFFKLQTTCYFLFYNKIMTLTTPGLRYGNQPTELQHAHIII